MAFGNPFNHPVQASIDGGLLTIFIATLMSVVPAITAVIILGYYAIQLWETETVKKWVRDHNARTAARRLRKLIAKEKIIRAEIEAYAKVETAVAEAAAVLKAAKVEAVISAKEVSVPPLPPLDPLPVQSPEGQEPSTPV